jgi:Clp amino terminal domain, pathogenicity island component
MNAERIASVITSEDPPLGLRASLALHRLAERVEANHVAAARERAGRGSGSETPWASPANPCTPNTTRTRHDDRTRCARDASRLGHLPHASEEARRRGDRRTGTDRVLLALFEDPSAEVVLGVSLQQAREALESLDHEALRALSLGPGADAPPIPMRAVPKKPRIRDVAQKDRFRMTPAAKKVLGQAYKPKGHRKLRVTGPEVLAQILTLQPPDPAAVLLGALDVDRAAVRQHLGATALAEPEQAGGRR